jgi:hypothetical protein
MLLAILVSAPDEPQQLVPVIRLRRFPSLIRHLIRPHRFALIDSPS